MKMKYWFLILVLMAAFALPWIMKPPKFPAAISGELPHRMIGKISQEKSFGTHPSGIQHPFMAPIGKSTIHSDGANSDVNRKGPLGKNLVVNTRVGSKWPGGMCATVTFSSQGLLVALCASLMGFELHLLTPKTLLLLAVHPLPNRPSTFAALVTLDPEKMMLDTSGGAYYFLDHEDCAVLADAKQTIQRVCHRRKEDGEYEFYLKNSWYIGNHVPHDCFNWNNWFPRGKCDPVTAVTPDFNQYIWWVTRWGIMGTVNPSTGAIRSFYIGEEMQNGITVAEDCIYVVTTYALYCMNTDKDGVPIVTWKETYDRGSFQKVGMLSQGSGTAPTVFGPYVTINDNADDQVNLLIYNRSATKEHRLICSEPLFRKGQSASDNSMIAVEHSVFMENNFGFRNGIQQTKWSIKDIPGGVQRVDLDPTTRKCRTVWYSEEKAPSCVAKLATETGLLYFSSYDLVDGEVHWCLLALSAHSGEVVFKIPTGKGRFFDNNWGPVTLGPDGTAYIGVLRGIVAIYDSE